MAVKLMTVGPMLLTAMLIAWTAAVHSHSQYGSWHAYPAGAVFPLVVIWHLSLIVMRKPRTPFVLYAIGHCAILAPIWLICLMIITKSSI